MCWEVLGRLDTQQLGTLLAAVAGYVLGRAATRTESGVGEEQGVGPTVVKEEVHPPSTGELARLLEVVAGTTSRADQPPTVSIREPVSSGQVYVTNQSPLSVAGKARDDTAVTEVQWQNATTKDSGIAILSDGTTTRNWLTPEIPLVLLGRNPPPLRNRVFTVVE